MSLDLTRVFDLSKNVFIEACAGAGKTWLLSKRFAAIMDDFAKQQIESPQPTKQDASNILVITFTRKAAAEMSERIYEDLNQLLNDKELKGAPQGFGQHLRQAPPSYKMHLRATYSRNVISTIDAFCAQILREQAERVDLDPEFRIQDEADTQRMVLETWERYLREQSDAHDPHLEKLLEQLSLFHINEYINKLHNHSELMQPWLKEQAEHSPDELEELFRKAHILPTVNPEIEVLLRRLSDELPEPASMLNSSNRLYVDLLEMRNYFQNMDSDDYRHCLHLLDFLRTLTLTQDGSKFLSSIRLASKVWPDAFLPTLREALKDLLTLASDQFSIERLQEQLPSLWDLTACRVNHHLAHFYLNYHEALSQRLRRENVLSFEEIILRTHDLLTIPEVAAHYGQKFKHILFDEFQDTNDLRWNIVRLIAEQGRGELRRQGLFIVGDTKQSIYRFNQADVQVMNRVRQRLLGEDAWDLRANETFRSSQTFVEQVINPFMGKAFPGMAEEKGLKLYETLFETCQAAEHNPLSERRHAFGRCSVHAVVAEGNSSSDIIKTGLVANSWVDWLKTNKLLDPKKPDPKVGILLRSFTHILDYINIFTQMGLKFEVVSSKGLFQQQECFDIYHLLSVLINPQDDLALIALLRSPFFIFTDQQIQELRDTVSLNRRTGWSWQALREKYPQHAAEITDWQMRSAREPVDRIVTDLLSTERQLGWISETGGLLRVENLKKLVNMMHNLALDGLSLRELQEYFKFQIQHGDAPQAEVPGGSEIQILTIHKSKGLEFPVVILPELHASPRNETSGMYLGEQNGRWEAGITLDGQTASHSTWLLERIKEQSKKEEEAEDRRLFYVAVTRAKYAVSFVCRVHPNRKPSSGSWWERYIQPVLDLPLDKDLLQNDPQELVEIWRSQSTPELELNLSFQDEISQPQADGLGDESVKLKATMPVTQELVFQEISPHTIMTWVDPHPAEGSDERQKGEDLGLATSALTFGRLLHRVMEMSWFDLETNRTHIQGFLIEEGVEEPEQQALLLEDLQGCLDIYRQSSLAEQLSQISSVQKLPELPVFGYLKNTERVYKVSGIIDLLYRHKGQWIVLDYKTDQELPLKPEKKEYAYWFQIQTYLWILKLLYGIEARGELYFNRFDQIIPIEFEPELYFQKLNRLPQARDLEPFLPRGSRAPEALIEIVQRLDQNQQTIIIEPTRDSCERLAQYLAHNDLNFPTLTLKTISELRRAIPFEGRQLTPYLARMGVAKLLGKRPQWGSVNRLAEAFYKASLGERINTEKAELYTTFKLWCSEHGIVTSHDLTQVYRSAPETNIIIDNIHATSPSDYEFLQQVAQHNVTTFLSPMKEGQVAAGFEMQTSDWMDQAEMPNRREDHKLIVSYDVQEEVRHIAHTIRKLVVEKIRPEQIQIAVSSMERYVPTIKRIFTDHGISVRLSKREPVMERPVTHLAFTLIQGRIAPHLSWDEAMAIWLNPLVCRPGKELNLRQRLDLEVRKLGFTHIDKALPEKLTKLLPEPLGEPLGQAAADLLTFIDSKWLTGTKADLLESADWLLDLLRSFEFTYLLEPGSVASKAYTSLKNAIEGVKRDWMIYLGTSGAIHDLNRELRERLRGVEVSSSEQGFGVDVVSFLDTLNQRSEYLFIMGFTEGQFPINPVQNPYLKPSSINPWFLNLTLFKSWLSMTPGHVFFSAPQRDVGGETIQISTFGQYLKQEDAEALPAYSPGEQYALTSGQRISDPESIWHERHNLLLDYVERNPWMGVTGDPLRQVRTEVSASAFDDLVKCPQRYWFARNLRLEAAETDIAQRQEIEIGNLVHRVLEAFGKARGFLTLAKDLDAALALLESEAQKVLSDYEVDLNASLMHQSQSNSYFSNMRDPAQNLLAALLQVEQEYVRAIEDEGLYEQGFGYPGRPDAWSEFEIADAEISLALRGQIDRVFKLGKHVWASDYKTGRVSIGDTREFWTSQLFFYYLVLCDQFPDKDVILTYEQVRSFKNGEWGIKGYLGDIGSEYPIVQSIPPRSKIGLVVEDGGEISKDWIKSETLRYARPLLQNHFPLTTRDESKACAYCPYDRVCRKTALPR